MLKQQTLIRFLKPIARLCLAEGVAVQNAVEALKGAFIEVAAEKIENSGESVNVSRLSVATGMHRRDVNRLYLEQKSKDDTPGIIAKVITQWRYDREFSKTDSKTDPLPLSFGTEEGQFERLVRKVTKNVHPGTVLQELRARGYVSEKNNKLKLLNTFHNIQRDVPAALGNVADEIGYLLCAVSENISLKNCSSEVTLPAHLHGRTEFDNISENDLPKIRKWLLEQGSSFHRKVRNYLTKYDKDINPAPARGARFKVVVGAFGYTERFVDPVKEYEA
jgi:hypothetical protein